MVTCGSKKTVALRNVVLGSGRLALIMPIAAKDTEEAVSLAKEFMPYKPDILEWRVDYFDQVENIPVLLEAAEKLRAAVGDMAVMVTPRHHLENGVREIQPEAKKGILLALIQSGLVDMVDVEMRGRVQGLLCSGDLRGRGPAGQGHRAGQAGRHRRAHRLHLRRAAGEPVPHLRGCIRLGRNLCLHRKDPPDSH